MRNDHTESQTEETAFMAKAVLASVWIGIDLIAALVLCTLSRAEVGERILVLSAAISVLISGTALSVIMMGASGASARFPAADKGGRISRMIGKLGRDSRRLVATGVLLASASLVATACSLALWSRGDEAPSYGRANAVVAKKCGEVARLERDLFRTDEQVVLAQCLIQYDEKYAALEMARSQKDR